MTPRNGRSIIARWSDTPAGKTITGGSQQRGDESRTKWRIFGATERAAGAWGKTLLQTRCRVRTVGMGQIISCGPS